MVTKSGDFVQRVSNARTSGGFLVIKIVYIMVCIVDGVIYSGTYWRIFLLDLYILEDCLWNLIAAFRIQFSCS